MKRKMTPEERFAEARAQLAAVFVIQLLMVCLQSWGAIRWSWWAVFVPAYAVLAGIMIGLFKLVRYLVFDKEKP